MYQFGQFPLCGFRVAEIEFDQAAQMADAVEINQLAHQPQLLLRLVGNACAHGNGSLIGEVYTGIDGLLFIKPVFLRKVQKQTFQGDIYQFCCTAVIALFQLYFGFKVYPAKTTSFVGHAQSL